MANLIRRNLVSCVQANEEEDVHDRQNYSENNNLAHMMSITILYKVGPGLVQTDPYISFAEKDIDIKLNPNRK